MITKQKKRVTCPIYVKLNRQLCHFFTDSPMSFATIPVETVDNNIVPFLAVPELRAMWRLSIGMHDRLARLPRCFWVKIATTTETTSTEDHLFLCMVYPLLF